MVVIVFWDVTPHILVDNCGGRWRQQVPWKCFTKFFRRTVGYTLFDHTRNEEIVEALTVETVNKK